MAIPRLDMSVTFVSMDMPNVTVFTSVENLVVAGVMIN